MNTILTGYHVIEEKLTKGNLTGVLYISRKNNRIDELVKKAAQLGVKIKRCNDQEIKRITGSSEHRGCALRAEDQSESLPETTDLTGFLKKKCREDSTIVLLDHLTDPHNLGAILRSCDQFGVLCVITTERRSASVTETVEKVSAGATAWIPVFTVTNLARTLDQLKEMGFWVFGADMGDQPCWSEKVAGRTVLAMGSEGKGLGHAVKEKCDAILSIPTSGHVDSLNVSVSAGILLYEITRQKKSIMAGTNLPV